MTVGAFDDLILGVCLGGGLVGAGFVIPGANIAPG